MKRIIYSKHLIFRLKVREIDENLPKKIYEQAEERYFDRITGNFIAVGRTMYVSKQREMVLVYKEVENVVEIITIHPLKSGQKDNRLKSGRWVAK